LRRLSTVPFATSSQPSISFGAEDPSATRISAFQPGSGVATSIERASTPGSAST
jgi:hypothetical protein